MHLRRTVVRRNNKKYSYAQIVESYRRKKDGLPATRVLCNLGALDDLSFENLKNAIEASKNGVPIVVDGGIKEKNFNSLKPLQNLFYLDVAVLFSLWKELNLDVIFNELCSFHSQSDIKISKVIFALVAHRCIDPNSKLHATKWIPKTYLPEEFHAQTSIFNNSRIHRALNALDKTNTQLMPKLCSRYLKDSKAFSTVFLDVTDTWFVGKGSGLSQTGKSKEGLIKKKLGIILMCNEKGFPLRWDLLPGNMNDSISMTEMVEGTKNLTWMKNVPLVCDRAMGKSAQIYDLVKSEIEFITAATKTEYKKYASDLPSIPLPEGEQDQNRLIKESSKFIKNKNWKKVKENLFVKDFGDVNINFVKKSERSFDNGNRVVKAMRICRRIETMVSDGTFTSYSSAGESFGMTKPLTLRYMNLRHLPLDIQDRVLDGQAKGATIEDLIQLGKEKDEDVLNETFLELCKLGQRKRILKKPTLEPAKTETIKVRVVASFNPELYAEQILKKRSILKKVSEFEKTINSKLSNSRKKRTEESIKAEVDRFLRRDSLLTCFNVSICKQGPKKLSQVSIELNEKEWQKKIKLLGFNVIVASNKVKLDPEQICQLYREKNLIEANFKTIKSFLEIRPIHHRTDKKIKAHITICMLSLLLERYLKQKIEKLKMTPQSVLSQLSHCYLNRYKVSDDQIYITTELDQTQRKILKQLNLEYLADDDYIREKIACR